MPNPVNLRGSRALRFSMILNRVAKVVVETAGQDITDWEANLSSLGIDSLVALEILAELEESFNIVLNETIVEEFYSITHIARIVQDAMRSSRGGDARGRPLSEMDGY
ncbi:MAG: acyl carrier protein [Deltaproteobacteria bacterium]|nr:acyl carrier protein [Deltaproteobacteria bacterium]